MTDSGTRYRAFSERGQVRSREAIVLAAAAAVVAVAGCGSSSVGAADGNSVSLTGATIIHSTATAPTQTQNGLRALNTAAKRVPGGRPYDLEADRFRGQPVWEVKVAVGTQRPHELKISKNGRRVIHRSRHKRDDDAAKALKAKTSLVRAIRVADRQVGGRLSEAEIDRHRGTLVWDITFDEPARQAEHEVTVNAATGQVVRVRTDKDD